MSKLIPSRGFIDRVRRAPITAMPGPLTALLSFTHFAWWQILLFGIFLTFCSIGCNASAVTGLAEQLRLYLYQRRVFNKHSSEISTGDLVNLLKIPYIAKEEPAGARADPAIAEARVAAIPEDEDDPEYRVTRHEDLGDDHGQAQVGAA
jgi:hypothetical protein